MRRGELPAVPLLSECLCPCWLRRALTCPSLSAISLTMSSLGACQASSVTSRFCQMGALHWSGCGMWPGLRSLASSVCRVRGCGLCHLEPVLPLLHRQAVIVWWFPGPAQLPAEPQQSVPSHPIFFLSMGGVRLGSRLHSISAAGQISSCPGNTLCSLQPIANTSTSSGCRGQGWCCPLPAPAT